MATANVGNTCYINSLLQCLYATTPLHAALSEAPHQRERCHNATAGCLTCSLRGFWHQMENSPRSEPVVPMEIVKAIVTMGYAEVVVAAEAPPCAFSLSFLSFRDKSCACQARSLCCHPPPPG